MDVISLPPGLQSQPTTYKGQITIGGDLEGEFNEKEITLVVNSDTGGIWSYGCWTGHTWSYDEEEQPFKMTRLPAINNDALPANDVLGIYWCSNDAWIEDRIVFEEMTGELALIKSGTEKDDGTLLVNVLHKGKPLQVTPDQPLGPTFELQRIDPDTTAVCRDAY